eukprot:g9553.t2
MPLSPVPEEAISTALPPPARDYHSLGLLSLANSQVWDTIREVQQAVLDAHPGVREQGGAEKQQGPVEESKESSPVEGYRDIGDDWSVGPPGAGVPLAMATRFATREEIDLALRDEQPPLERPDMPLRPVDELPVPHTYNEMLRSEYSTLVLDAQQREVFGLIEAKAFKPVNL